MNARASATNFCCSPPESCTGIMIHPVFQADALQQFPGPLRSRRYVAPSQLMRQ